MPAGRQASAASCRFVFFLGLAILSAFKLNGQDALKIGLLIPDSKSNAAQQGAELAVSQINRKGGFHGNPFRIVVRSMEGSWGTGSKQAVDLIFTEKVYAIIVSNDGRNAHLAEQAVTKTQVPMISAWSGDPTLSQAFVPWFFTCVPNNLQQGFSLVSEIYVNRKCKKVSLIVDEQYDSKSAEAGFRRKLKESRLPDPTLFTVKPGQDITTLVRQVKSTSTDAIVVFCEPVTALKIIRQFGAEKMKQPVFGTSFLMNENILTTEEIHELDHSIWLALGNWSGAVHDAFVKEYGQKYGKKPGLVATFSYDATLALLEAIRKGGTERMSMQKALMNLQLAGATGPVRFDDKGNRTGSFSPVMLRAGLPDTL